MRSATVWRSGGQVRRRQITQGDASVETGAGEPRHGIAFGEALRVWTRVAALSFGGPAGQIAVMHRILVEEKQWIGEARFMHALSYCMLLPGPEAQQLATYIGWLLHRVPGGLVAGGLFILPGAVTLMALSIIYAQWGHAPFVGAIFFGLKAAVLAVVLQALVRIGRRALGSRRSRAVAAVAFVAIFFFAVPFPLIIAAAAGVGLLKFHEPAAREPAASGSGPGNETRDEGRLGAATPMHARPDARRTVRTTATWLTLWLAPVLAVWWLAGGDSVFTAIASFFARMALVTFGGAYAVLAYVAQQAVETHWLTAGEMLDGLGLAETTPGPLIMVLQFVGFLAAFRAPEGLPPLVAGVLGGLLATWVTFVPSFLWVFAGGPYVEALRGRPALARALASITAAVVGVILNLSVWFAVHVLFVATLPVRGYGVAFDAPVLASLDWRSLLLALGSAVAIFRLRIGVAPVLAAAGLAGVALYAAGLLRP